LATLLLVWWSGKSWLVRDFLTEAFNGFSVGSAETRRHDILLIEEGMALRAALEQKYKQIDASGLIPATGPPGTDLSEFMSTELAEGMPISDATKKLVAAGFEVTIGDVEHSMAMIKLQGSIACATKVNVSLTSKVDGGVDKIAKISATIMTTCL